MKSNREAVWEVLAQINQVILGKETLTAEVLAALLAGGHVLLEDLPGSGRPPWRWRYLNFWDWTGKGCSLRRMCCHRI
ncbi:MAG: hypothetical protein ACLRMZ_23435 [Blautia marasmi]